MPISIILADDHGVVRHGLRAALEQEPDFQVAAEAEDGEQAVALCARHAPQVVLMDIHMPGISGSEAARRILAENPQIKVLALTMYADPRYVRDMLEAGAAGYVLKNCAFEELAGAIRTAVRGGVHLSREAAGSAAALVRGQGVARSKAALLSPREREVACLVALGLTSREIALRLHISENTVESHRRHAMRKLDLRNAAQLTSFVLREGLVTPPDG
jgi:DNA-binding NarL/FixJ family response regulator